MSTPITIEGTTDNRLLQYRSFSWVPEYLEPSSGWIEHIPFGFWFMEVLRPRIVVELGVHYGVSYFSFCQAIKNMDIDTACFGIDTWKGDEHAGFYGDEVFQEVSNYNTREFFRFSTLIRTTFDEARQYFIDGTIDVLHIDGLHTYEAVKHDFELWLPKVSHNGFVMLHDTNVREKNFGVFRLWEELKQKFTHLEFDFGHGLGIISRGKDMPKELEGLFNANRNETYYAFLRNNFSERGHFYKVICNNNFQLEQQRNNLEQLADANGELTAGLRALELHNKEMDDDRKALELQIAQLNEAYQTLQLQTVQVNEINSKLEIDNAKFLENNKDLALENNQLRTNLEGIQAENIELSEKFAAAIMDKEPLMELERINNELKQQCQKEVTTLTERLELIETSLKSTLDQLSQAGTEKELLKTYIEWYQATYENRNILGIVKDRLKNWLKLDKPPGS